MTEDFLHYLWQFQLFGKDLFTTNGEQIQVLFCGTHNTNSGPDFFNARIKLGNTLWAGNVEIHVKASEWNLHKHNTDRAYDNVVLHVVARNDCRVFRTNGEEIPCLEIPIHPLYLRNYESLVQNLDWIPCHQKIQEVEAFHISFQLNQLLIERFEEKAATILDLLDQNHRHWEEAFFQSLARNFGLKVNAGPFEMLARSIPLAIIRKHQGQLFQLEALLLGQAGFLSESASDEYFQRLQLEYDYLSKIHHLKPLERGIWKLMRLRPSNFPSLRIAQLASLLHHQPKLFSQTIEGIGKTQITQYFSHSPSEYWETHYLPGKQVTAKPKPISSEMIGLIIINTIVPFLFALGKDKADPAYFQAALEVLEKSESDQNSIIRRWKLLGIESPNAAVSQALLQLFSHYCLNRKCLECGIGDRIIREKLNQKGSS